MADGNSRIGRRRGSVVAAASSHEAEHALAARYPRVVPDHVRLASVMPAKQLVTPIVGNIVGTAAYHERVVERVELVARAYRPQSSPVVVLFAVRVDVILLEPYLLDRISDLVQNRYRAEKPGPRVIEHHLPSPEVDFTDMLINQLFRMHGGKIVDRTVVIVVAVQGRSSLELSLPVDQPRTHIRGELHAFDSGDPPKRILVDFRNIVPCFQGSIRFLYQIGCYQTLRSVVNLDPVVIRGDKPRIVVCIGKAYLLFPLGAVYGLAFPCNHDIVVHSSRNGCSVSVAAKEKTYFVPSVSQTVKRLSLPYSIFTPL